MTSLGPGLVKKDMNKRRDLHKKQGTVFTNKTKINQATQFESVQNAISERAKG